MLHEYLHLGAVTYTYCISQNKKVLSPLRYNYSEKLTLFSSKFFYIRNSYYEELYYPSQLKLECIDDFDIGDRDWEELPIENYHDVHMDEYDLIDVEMNVKVEDFDPSKLTIKYGYVCMGEPNYNYEVGVIVSIEYDGVSIYNAQKTTTL